MVHEWNGHLQIFSRPQVIQNSRQYLVLRTDILPKTVVGAPVKTIEHYGRFPLSPNLRLEIKWSGPFRFGPTGIFESTFDRSGLFGRSDRNVPFHLTKLLSPLPLFCILLPFAI